MRSTVGFTSPSTPSSPSTITSHPHPSAWHSPVPYLFGGLAAMLGLIAFALLILACSYWKVSGFLDGDDDGNNAENGENDGAKETDVKPQQACYEQRIVVIMAGDEKPTFLATPISSRASSFGDNGSSANGKRSNGDGDGEVEGKKMESLSTAEDVNDQNSQRQEP